jgi:RNA methyltransferase, trmH family
VDLYNDKVVRSMQGSQFHVGIYHENLTDVYGKLKENDIPIAVTALHRDAKDFKWLTGRESVAIVVGNEGNGVRDELIESADFIIQIPMFGQAESLNVAIATGILMYQTRI